MERVGIDDNYFALGGDSIRSIRLVAAAATGWGSHSRVPQLYRYQTVRELAAAGLPEARAPDAVDATSLRLLSRPMPRQPAGGRRGCLSGEPRPTRHALPHERDPDARVYHEVLSCGLDTRFDEAPLREALRRVAARHPILRTSFDLAAEPLSRSSGRPAGSDPAGGAGPARAQDARRAGGLDEPRRRRAASTRAQAPLVRFRIHLLGGRHVPSDR